MKNSPLLLLMTLWSLTLSPLAQAMELNGEKSASSHVYAPSISAVQKAMDKMGIKYVVDQDGDLEYEMDSTGWTVYVIFHEMENGQLWNLQMMARFSTKKSRYDELVAFCNQWNAEYFFQASMADRDSLELSFSYPVQYGFNSDEFEDNVLGLFESYLVEFADKTDEYRR